MDHWSTLLTKFRAWAGLITGKSMQDHLFGFYQNRVVTKTECLENPSKYGRIFKRSAWLMTRYYIKTRYVLMDDFSKNRSDSWPGNFWMSFLGFPYLETHVQHSISLIKTQKSTKFESDFSALEEIDEATGCCDQQVASSLQIANLFPDICTTINYTRLEI